MRYIQNEDSDLTSDTICGIRSVYPGLYVNPSNGIILLNRDRSHRVALLAGCGAGHEPFGAGLVGENCLTGFISGPIFDSPPVGSICYAIKCLAQWNRGGILILIINNSASRLSFDLAVERSKALGINVRMTVMSDDCSLSGADDVQNECIADRRTLSGCAIFSKVLGGLSASGSDMEELLWEERLLKARTASASVCYAPCNQPGKRKFHFPQRKGTIVLGVGTNGEEGGRFTFKHRPIDEIIALLMKRLLPRCLMFDKGSVVVLINNVGTLTKMESYIIANFVIKELESRDVAVSRMYTGKVLTSLNMKGFTLTLTNVTEKELWLEQLDQETEAFAWPGSKLSRPPKWPKREFTHDVQDITQMCGKELGHNEINDLKKCLTAVCKALISHKRELDALCLGTGVMLGTEMNNFAEGTLNRMKQDCSFLQSLSNAFLVLSSISEDTMSTSAAGSIYSLLLIGAALGAQGSWPDIWESAVHTLTKYTAAKIGYRSLLDSLVPACGVFRRVIARDGEQVWRAALKAAVETAEESCAETKTMISKATNSPFFQPSEHDEEEAGARAVVIILRAIYGALCSSSDQPGMERQDVRLSSLYYQRDSIK